MPGFARRNPALQGRQGAATLLDLPYQPSVRVKGEDMRKLSILIFVAVVFLGTAAATQAQGTIPADAEIIVALNQAVSSKDAQVGQKIPGVVDKDVVVGGKTLIPRGSKVTMTVVDTLASGRLKGQAKLWLKISSVVVKTKTYTVASNSSGQTGPSHNKRNVVAIGGGTAAGAIIGGIAGGGKGAAIGAAVGAAAGTGAAAATGKKDVEFHAETKLRFTLKKALTVS